MPANDTPVPGSGHGRRLELAPRAHQQPRAAWLGVVFLMAVCRLIAYLPPEINSFATSHYLFSYAAGFHKRALVGSLLSLCLDRVDGTAIYAISLCVLAAMMIALAILLRRILLTSGAMLIVGAVLLGAPGVLPHFAYAIGYFDPILVICALAALAVFALPIPDWSKPTMALLPCAFAVLTHESFVLAAFPLTVAWLLVARTSRALVWGLAAAVAVLTLTVQALGKPAIPLEQYVQQAALRADTPPNIEAFQLLYFKFGQNLSYLLRHYASMGTDARLLAGLIAPIPYFVLLRDLYVRAAGATETAPGTRRAVLACIFAPVILSFVGFDVLRWVSFACLNCSILIFAYVRSDGSGGAEKALDTYVRSPRFILLALLSYALGALHVVDSNSLGSGVHAMARGLGIIKW